ncbi:DEAD-domain-containing protein [Delitschia confertaspora ATCC 74209]|uniref:RNA helicase n=1 Tax=Delitschia confertaspora ATCC 74209 TaxID=1513339 RepID=A0A9P4MQL3_9PLEO|nr:DEAD-domain-containing protein [Delitschia confertaspora ATCC 74209]
MASESTEASASLESRITKDDAPKDVPEVDGAVPVGKDPALVETEYEVVVKLADMQADPNNPLFSAKEFKDLNLRDELLRGIQAMNFRKPSKVQEKALPLLLADPPMNMIAQSQSGTGKTAAFSLNILARVDISNPRPQALVLAPSRELARQILGVISTMGQFIEGLKTMAAIPDPTQRNKKFDAHILVGTPGTVMDMIRRRHIDVQDMRILVLDEADNMLDQQGLGEQCNRVKTLLPKGIQTVLFSATFPQNVIEYAHRFSPKANVLTLRHDELTIEGIKQMYIDCEGASDKYATLLKFYGLLTQASSIIFVRSRKTANELRDRMVADNHTVAVLTGELEGHQRDEVIDSFRNGTAKVLIATNVIARGIDVESVTMVINYVCSFSRLQACLVLTYVLQDVPTDQMGRADPETYLHRIGRTGRFGRVGVALTFVHDRKSWQALKEIAEYFKMDLVSVDISDWDNVEKMVNKIVKSSAAGKSTKEMTSM